MLELRRRESFLGFFYDFFTPVVAAELVGVSVFFGIPFTHSAYGAWRECGGGYFVPISCAILMFQFGLATTAYANLIYGAGDRGSDAPTATQTIDGQSTS